MKPSAVILIATRPESSRLPQKVFKEIAGVPAIDHILFRIAGTGLPVYLCVPYGCSAYDETVERHKKNMNVKIFFGDPASPLHRMAECVKEENLQEEWIVRITHDDILIDDQTLIHLLETCNDNPEAGYGYTPSIVEGSGVEVFRSQVLLKAARSHTEPTEFVSYFVKGSPDYPVDVKVRARPTVERNYRLTMDYQEDATLLNFVLSKVGPYASLDTIVRYIDLHPSILNINKQPDVTIYTCAYNAEKTISKTISSVIRSNRSMDIEYLIVDDGSTDKTLYEVSKFLGMSLPIKVISNFTNKGLAVSSNVALDHARGKYVIRVDADDWLCDDAIDKMKTTLEYDGSAIVYAGYFEHSEEEDTYDPVVKNPRVNHHAGSALMDKRMINELRFSNHLRHWEGLDLYNRILMKGFKISYMDDPLWFYQRRSSSLSSVVTEDRKQAYREVMSHANK